MVKNLVQDHAKLMKDFYASNQRIENLQKQLDIAREALKFYGSAKNWTYNADEINTNGICVKKNLIENDSYEYKSENYVLGKRAKQALEQIGGE